MGKLPLSKQKSIVHYSSIHTEIEESIESMNLNQDRISLNTNKTSHPNQIDPSYLSLLRIWFDDPLQPADCELCTPTFECVFDRPHSWQVRQLKIGQNLYCWRVYD